VQSRAIAPVHPCSSLAVISGLVLLAIFLCACAPSNTEYTDYETAGGLGRTTDVVPRAMVLAPGETQRIRYSSVCPRLDTGCLVAFVGVRGFDPARIRFDREPDWVDPTVISYSFAGRIVRTPSESYVALDGFIEVTALPGAAPGSFTLRLEERGRDPFEVQVTIIASRDTLATLSVTAVGNGTVASSPAGLLCAATGTCTTQFSVGSYVSLSAIPATGWRFAGWSGGPECSAASIQMFAPVQCTATFVPLSVTLTVEVGGSGSGSVHSQPAGISCGFQCSLTVDFGTNVRLTATHGSGQSVQWSGSPGCSGTGDSVDLRLESAQTCRATIRQAPTDPPEWSTLGAAATGPNVRAGAAVAFDSSGAATVAYVDDGADQGALHVRRWIAGQWQAVGGSALNSGGRAIVGRPALVLDATGAPVVAWADGAGALRVSTWNGTTWVSLSENLAMGGAGAPTAAPQMERSGTQLVVAFVEYVAGQARAVVRRTALGAPPAWTGGYVPNASATGGMLVRLALDAQGAATILTLPSGASGTELPLRAYEEAGGSWQALCGPFQPGGATPSYASSTIGFGIQRDLTGDGSALAFGTSPDYRQIIGARCVGGFWERFSTGNSSGVFFEADNNLIVLRDAVMVPGTTTKSPTLLISVSTGYAQTIELRHYVLGTSFWLTAPNMGRSAASPSGGLAAAPMTDIGPGVVLATERTGGGVDLELWRYTRP
jgi:Divergent InlB B-repeat domain